MMMIQAGTELYEQMKKKLDILQKISTNTKIQIRFIHQRKLKGLSRLLQERAQYLQELEALNKEVDSTAACSEAVNEAVKKIVLLINAKQQEIIKDNNEALEAAKAERDNIKTKLQQVRMQKKIQNRYENNQNPVYGNRINTKG